LKPPTSLLFPSIEEANPSIPSRVVKGPYTPHFPWKAPDIQVPAPPPVMEVPPVAWSQSS